MKIGNYLIEQVDEDNFSVLSISEVFESKVILCGGDFETLLSALFISTEKYHRFPRQQEKFIKTES